MPSFLTIDLMSARDCLYVVIVHWLGHWCFCRTTDDGDCKNTLPVDFMFVDNPASMTKKKHGCSVVRHLAVNSAQTGARGRLELDMRYEQSSLLKASWCLRDEEQQLKRCSIA